eukprot:TRINITY_DN12075_c0_g2_i1.p1 TRINITY_DN12075_c0_g2~~TRINITY_DN12075_c0_g2_i1.p1  ORF type:complete len:325 (+),score=52.10 TRINITY_DN12075_c0_g2_i1:51-1025(+)
MLAPLALAPAAHSVLASPARPRLELQTPPSSPIRAVQPPENSPDGTSLGSRWPRYTLPRPSSSGGSRTEHQAPGRGAYAFLIFVGSLATFGCYWLKRKDRRLAAARSDLELASRRPSGAEAARPTAVSWPVESPGAFSSHGYGSEFVRTTSSAGSSGTPAAGVPRSLREQPSGPSASSRAPAASAAVASATSDAQSISDASSAGLAPLPTVSAGAVATAYEAAGAVSSSDGGEDAGKLERGTKARLSLSDWYAESQASVQQKEKPKLKTGYTVFNMDSAGPSSGCASIGGDGPPVSGKASVGWKMSDGAWRRPTDAEAPDRQNP